MSRGYGLRPVSFNAINDLSSGRQSGTTYGTTALSIPLPLPEVGDHFGASDRLRYQRSGTVHASLFWNTNLTPIRFKPIAEGLQ